MPLDEAGLLRVVLRVLGGFFEAVLDFFFYTCHTGDVLGYLGAWTVRIVTLGYCKPDPESWGMIFLGFVVLVALCVLVGLNK